MSPLPWWEGIKGRGQHSDSSPPPCPSPIKGEGIQGISGWTLGINEEGAIVEKDGEKGLISNVDTIIWAIVSVSNSSLVDELKGSPYEVYTVGDANEPRDALSAIEEGHRAALNI